MYAANGPFCPRPKSLPSSQIEGVPILADGLWPPMPVVRVMFRSARGTTSRLVTLEWDMGPPVRPIPLGFPNYLARLPPT